ncbi:hypothetical protein ACH4M4_28965 [Streptomyces sp. NPDC017254]|uniref:hypothetical protein n=1 Tax=unclassified Streptomyces TaxID=2593676 RepID=UPI0037A2AA5C
MMRTRLKMAATLAAVVLALTGFQTGHGHGSSSGGGSGKSKSRSGDSDSDGGGCSNSRKSNDDYDGSGDSGGSGTSDEYTYDPTPTATPTAAVYVTTVDCVKPAQQKRKGKPARRADTTTTLKIVSDAWEEKTFRVLVHFEDANHKEVDRAEATVTVERRGTKRFEVEMAHPGTVGRVRECVAFVDGEVAPGTTPTPSATSS